MKQQNITKNFAVPSLDITLATIAISFKQPPSTTELVLAQLIHYSENSMITQPRKLANTIISNLKIKQNNYRASIAKLYKLNLITKQNETIILSPIIKTPFQTINIKQLPSHE